MTESGRSLHCVNYFAARTHGKGGPVKVQLPEYTGMGEIYVQAAHELGYPRQDLNGYFTEGD